jgi:hypothetical protein
MGGSVVCRTGLSDDGTDGREHLGFEASEKSRARGGVGRFESREAQDFLNGGRKPRRDCRESASVAQKFCDDGWCRVSLGQV